MQHRQRTLKSDLVALGLAISRRFEPVPMAEGSGSSPCAMEEGAVSNATFRPMADRLPGAVAVDQAQSCRPPARRQRMHRSLAILGAVSLLAVVSAGDPAAGHGNHNPPPQTLSDTWPAAWEPALGSSGVGINTTYGAFGFGCSNHGSTYYDTYIGNGLLVHLGLDLNASNPHAVKAIGDGVVTKADEIWGAKWKGVVLVKHTASSGEQFTAVYGHIDIGQRPGFGRAWTTGDPISRGDIVGTVAALIDPDDPAHQRRIDHLHFGISPGSDSKTFVDGSATSQSNPCAVPPGTGTVDPFPYLRGLSPAGGGTPVGNNPHGSLDSATRVAGGIRLVGWAKDADDTNAALRVDALVDGGDAGQATANVFRGDGGIGAHGFDFTVPANDDAHSVCVRASNVGGGQDAQLPSCIQVPQVIHFPDGNLDSAVRVPDGVRLVGWAADADTTGAISVHGLVDRSKAGEASAGLPYPGRGAHGFDFVLPVDWRSREICARGINVGGGSDVDLPGCQRIPFLDCPTTSPTIVGTEGDDQILGTPGNDVIWALGGHDEIDGGGGDDIICGGAGDDDIVAKKGNSLVFGGPGDDRFVGGTGANEMITGAGHDRAAVGPKDRVLDRSETDEVEPRGSNGPSDGLVTTAGVASPANNQPNSGGNVPATGSTSSTTATIMQPSTTPTSTPLSTATPPTTASPPTTAPVSPPTTTPVSPPPTGDGTSSGRVGPPACAATSMAASAATYSVAGTGGAGVVARPMPAPQYPQSYALEEGAPVSVVCWADGAPVNGSTKWDRLADGNWVPDVYLNTPKE